MHGRAQGSGHPRGRPRGTRHRIYGPPPGRRDRSPRRQASRHQPALQPAPSTHGHELRTVRAPGCVWADTGAWCVPAKEERSERVSVDYTSPVCFLRSRLAPSPRALPSPPAMLVRPRPTLGARPLARAASSGRRAAAPPPRANAPPTPEEGVVDECADNIGDFCSLDKQVRVCGALHVATGARGGGGAEAARTPPRRASALFASRRAPRACLGTASFPSACLGFTATCTRACEGGGGRAGAQRRREERREQLRAPIRDPHLSSPLPPFSPPPGPQTYVQAHPGRQRERVHRRPAGESERKRVVEPRACGGVSTHPLCPPGHSRPSTTRAPPPCPTKNLKF